MGRYKKLSGNDLSKDAEGKFSGNMNKLILPKLKKGKYLFRLMAHSLLPSNIKMPTLFLIFF